MKPFGKTRHIHFVGIGGIGMSGIAELLINLGYEVSGSDLKDSPVTRRLVSLGGRVWKGHSKEHVAGADVVVYSSAIARDNPELVEAAERYIPVIPRAEMLAELMRLRYGVAIAGAHGKTTTTSMLASILTCGHLDPTVVIGGRLDIWGGSNAKLGQGDFLVAEADESDGSFLALSPTIAVVTNIDREHMDHYGEMDRIRETFVQFINKIPFYGAAVLCLDDEEIQGIIPMLNKRYVTYGLNPQADLRARDLNNDVMGVGFEVVVREGSHVSGRVAGREERRGSDHVRMGESDTDRSLGRIRVGLPGRHNVLNALAATAVGLELGLDLNVIKEGLENLGGLERRFQVKGEEGHVLVVDDYGHHPTEIQATLDTARACWPERRMVVVFQPHRYTRTKDLFDRFVVCFNAADILLVSEVYSAGEKPLDGVTGDSLAQGIRQHGHKNVHYCPDLSGAVSELLSLVEAGDLVITLGAGDIDKTGAELLEGLRKRGGSRERKRP